MTPRQSLSTSERLKSHRKIRLLFAEGKKFKHFPLVVYYVLRRVEEVEEVGGGLERLRELNPVEEVEGVEEVETGTERLRELNPVEEVEKVERDNGSLRELEGVLQMGVSVGTRHFKRAVDRNLLKRRIREAYRKQKQELKELLLASGYSMDVFFVYANARISDYAEIETAMTSALSILGTKIATK